MKDGLGTGIVRGNVEHINICVRTGDPVNAEGDQTAGQKEGKGTKKAFSRPVCLFGPKTEDSGKNQKKMPEKTMQCEGNIGMHQSAGFYKCHDTAQKSKILDKRTGNLPVRWFQEGQDQTEIHGNAAKLKGKIPPVIGTGMDHHSEEQLLVQFAGSQKKTAAKQYVHRFLAHP